MKTNRKDHLVEIYAGPPMKAEIVRGLLENSGIEAFLKDEIMGSLAPWHASPGGVNVVKVMISNLDYTKAKSIIEAFITEN